MKKILLVVLPLLILSCGHKEEVKKTVVMGQPKTAKKAVVINPVQSDKVAGKEANGIEKKLIEWNGIKYAVTTVYHCRPNNPAAPGYALSFSGINMHDGSRTIIMMQVPDRVKVGSYKVLFDPDFGKRLGNRDKKEMSLIGHVVQLDTKGQIVPVTMESGNVMNDGKLEVLAVDEETFSVKATLKTVDGNVFRIDYTGKCNVGE